MSVCEISNRDYFIRFNRWCHKAFEVHPPGGRALPIEGLRAFAVLLVFAVHDHALFSNFAPRGTLTYRISEFGSAIGNEGVDIFFIISGYLLYGAVLRKQTPFFRFLGRRCRRIYPVFLTVLLIYLAAGIAIPGLSHVRWNTPHFFAILVENILFLPGIFPIVPIILVAWSLSYEFLFYLVMPIAVAAMGMRAWPRSRRVGFFIALVAIEALLDGLNLIGHLRMAMFPVGMLLYETIDSRIWEGLLVSAGEAIAIMVFCMASFLVAWLVVDRSVLLTLPGSGHCIVILRLAILGSTVFPVMVFSLCFDGVLRHFFSLALMRWIGNISYSFYLFHGISMHVLRDLMRMVLPSHFLVSVVLFWALMPVVLGIATTLSAVLFLVIEKPFSLSMSSSASKRAESSTDALSAPPDEAYQSTT